MGPPPGRWTHIFKTSLYCNADCNAFHSATERPANACKRATCGRPSLLRTCANTPETSLVHPGPSPRGGGPPKKGINKEYNDFSPKLSAKCRVLKLRCLAFPRGPGGFRELRGAGRNHFHLCWYLLVPGITSYDPKRRIRKFSTKKVSPLFSRISLEVPYVFL